MEIEKTKKLRKSKLIIENSSEIHHSTIENKN